jgi:ankyrin repeat protein
MNSKKIFAILALFVLAGAVLVLLTRERRLRTATVGDLIRAVVYNDRQEIEAILSRRPELLNEAGSRGTPLRVACGDQMKDMAEFLIEKGADVDAGGPGTSPPLIIAVRSQYKDIVRLLLEKGANPNVRLGGGKHILFVAAQSGDLDIIRLLVAHGADVNATNNQGQTILFYDFVLKDNELLTLTLDKGANINVRDEDGSTPIDIAVRYNLTQTVQTLRQWQSPR